MIPFIFKTNNLRALMEPLLKTDALSFHIQTKFQRTLCGTNILQLRSINKEKISEVDMVPPAALSGKKKDFGKIIELDENFDEIADTERKKSGKKNIDSKNAVLQRSINIFSSLMTQLKTKKGREKTEEIALEGKRLIKDAISSGCTPTMIFYNNEEDLEKLPKLPKSTRCYKLPYKNISFWSNVLTSQGLIGIFNKSEIVPQKSYQFLPLTVICDNVRDPGNIGSMLRVMAGVGCEKLILTKGCTDIWDSKVLRAGSGAHFRVPVVSNLTWSDIEKEISEDTEVLLADLSDSSGETSKNKDETKSDLSAFGKKSELLENLQTHCYYSLNYKNKKTAIIIGGETYGVSDEAYKFTIDRNGKRVFIPMSNEFESLNNAMTLGILAYEFKRQLDLNKQDATN